MRKLSVQLTLTLTFGLLFLANKSIAQDSTYVKEGTIKVETSESIKQLIAKKRTYNKNLKTVQGYKIQIYYGSEQAAIKKMEEFKTAFPEVATRLWLDKVDWKVWVGNYKKRLEADRALKEIKEQFPSAIPITTKVKI